MTMARVTKSRRAQRDYLDIWKHIARDNIRAADDVLDAFDAALPDLVRFPGMGTTRDDLAEGLRCWPVGNYLLLYRRVKGGIQLSRVLHGARNLKAVFRKRK